MLQNFKITTIKLSLTTLLVNTQVCHVANNCDRNGNIQETHCKKYSEI